MYFISFKVNLELNTNNLNNTTKDHRCLEIRSYIGYEQMDMRNDYMRNDWRIKYFHLVASNPPM